MNDIVTELVRRQHERQIAGGYAWPGKPLGASATTRYPNLLEELGWSAPWLNSLASFADVSQEVMVAVLEDNEPLTGRELSRLSRYLGVSVGYLTAPKFAEVDPATNKGKARRRALADLIAQADRVTGFGYERRQAASMLKELDRGEAIMYGPYHWAISRLQNALASNKRRPRDFRISDVFWEEAQP